MKFCLPSFRQPTEMKDRSAKNKKQQGITLLNFSLWTQVGHCSSRHHIFMLQHSGEASTNKNSYFLFCVSLNKGKLFVEDLS